MAAAFSLGASSALSRDRPPCCTAYEVGAVTRTVPFPKLDGMLHSPQIDGLLPT